MLASYALNLGRSWWTVASQIATLANFYLTTWEEYYTGNMLCSVASHVFHFIVLSVFGFWSRKVEARPDRDHKDHKTAQTDPYIRSLAVL